MSRLRSAIIAIAAVLAAGTLAAEEPPAPKSLEQLTSTLMRKGVLTQDEGKDILARAAQERAEGPAVVPILKGTKLKINALGQFRYTFTPGDRSAASSNSSSFMVRTARLKFSGELPRDFKYTLQLAFERATGAAAQQNSALYDLALSYAPTPAFTVTGGQFAIPVGEETNQPIDGLDLAERWYAQGRFLNPSCNHDVGIMAHGRPFGRRLYYALGVFNGRGANYADSEDGRHLYAARLEGVPLRWQAYGLPAEVVVGASGLWKRTSNDPSSWRSTDMTGATFDAPFDRLVYGANAALRLGPWALKGEYMSAQLRGRGSRDSIVRGYGYYLQASGRLWKERLEPVVRFQTYDPDDRLYSTRAFQWTTLGLNWFIHGQNVRLLANYTFKKERNSPVSNDEFITQLQLSF
jgi:hypothetical protein